jgi:hypothetical protein
MPLHPQTSLVAVRMITWGEATTANKGENDGSYPSSEDV